MALTLDVAPQATVQPEVATPCAAPFDSDEWLFGIDWDGSRAMLSVDAEGRVRLQGLMASLTDRFPEVASAAAALPPGTTLDGVLSILGADGRPDLAALSARIAGSHRTAGVFLATDIVRAGGTSVIREPYVERLARLSATLTDDPHVQAPEPVAGQGVALAAAADDQRLSALLARRRSAAYAPGMRSPERLRIDLSGSVDRVVVGRRDTGDGVELLLGEVVDGRLRYVQSESFAPSPAVGKWFDQAVEPVVTPGCDDARAAGDGVTWLRPRLCVTVGDPSRRTDPAVLAVRDDIDPRWCVRREPVPPPASRPTPRHAWSPTVLRALPLDAA